MKKTNSTLLRYPGGKFYALKFLKPFWEKISHDEYREPFFGGGSVFFAKPKSKLNWINDLEPELINLLKVISDDDKKSELLKYFEGEVEATKDKYNFVKTLTSNNDIEKAYKFYYLNRTSYSGKMKNPSWGYRPKRSVPPYRWKEKIDFASTKLKNVKITNLDFEDVISAPPMGNCTLIYLDPPYYKVKQENHYIKFFSKEDHLRLSVLLKNTTHKFFLTYDDCEEIRQMYSWAYIYEYSFFYRLDNSRDNSNYRKKGNELVITNYLMDKNSEK